MLSDKELDQGLAKLAEFQVANTKHHDSLTELLEQHLSLVEDYKRLKSDYEEERDARERYKQMARGQERNPFVLVLVDGDGYVFDDDLISNGAEGGQRAAHLLDTAVKRSLRERGLEDCRIMVRVYANLSGLSKALSRSKLAGPEKRSLAPFAANFTRSKDMFDFVDAGELKENADFKIRALFHHFIENSQCRHIFFAGCHDVGYINELTPYAANRERITLIRHPAFHPEFNKLGMRIEDFHNIFRTTPLDGSYTHHVSTTTHLSTLPTQTPFKKAPTYQTQDSNSAASMPQVCKFFQSGNCKYGDTCRHLHIKSKTNGATKSGYGGLDEVKQWRNSGSAPLPFKMEQLAKSDNDFMAGNGSFDHASPPQNKSYKPHWNKDNTTDFSEALPKYIPDNKVALNADSHRLDTYNAPILKQDSADFDARIAEKKLCNHFQLSGYCSQGNDCPYDHAPVTEGVLNVLKLVSRSAPCPKKGACRKANCAYGHICQKNDCAKRGGKQWCKFPGYVHEQDMRVARVVEGQAEMPHQRNGRGAEKASERDSSTPVGQSEAGDERESEGALLDLEEEDGASLD